MSSTWQSISLRNAVNRLMEDSFVQPPVHRRAVERAAVPSLPLDVFSSDEAVVITANVPGLNPDDVDINIEGDVLTIQGEFRKSEAENGSWLVQERYQGPFRTILSLNMAIQIDRAEAAFKDGVLTLTLPKAEKIRPKVIKVKSS
jgi:HSP20 family protein